MTYKKRAGANRKTLTLYQNKRLYAVAVTDLIVPIREHLPILPGTRVTALRELKNTKRLCEKEAPSMELTYTEKDGLLIPDLIYN